MEYEVFLKLHQPQLESSGIPSHLWKALWEKCAYSVIDGGQVFSFEYVEGEKEDDSQVEDKTVTDMKTVNQEDIEWKVSVICKEGINPNDPKQIYLIDHAWTYTVNNARQTLLTNNSLLIRMSNLMKIASEEHPKEQVIDKVMHEMWRYNQPYSFSAVESVIFGSEKEMSPVWYIMDELGSRIRHSDQPTFRTVPFFYHQMQITYTLLYPIKKVKFGDEVTRNFIEFVNSADNMILKAMMLPWKRQSLMMVDCTQREPDTEFIRSGRVEESLPDMMIDIDEFDYDGKMKVFSDYSVIKENLKHPLFEIASNEAEAHILWVTYHFKEFRELSLSKPYKFINQFPFEHILTSKDLLAVVCRRAANGDTFNPDTLETYPQWLPTTFNLITELCQFVSYFQQREKRSLDNYWICKPWNKARGMDMYITDNLSQIMRLRSTGPKVACKYISDPVLFPRKDVGLVKMDIRYIVLLKTIEPLEVYAYDRFWLRFANKPFSLDSFDDYEKHFTVMNYTGGPMKQMFCKDFIKIFEEYYDEHKWNDIKTDIFIMFKEIFKAATIKKPYFGILPNVQSRAMYGVDLMLQWDRKCPGKPRIQPAILEVNFSPDCQRACQYYPEFFDEVFTALFLDEVKNPHFVLL